MFLFLNNIRAKKEGGRKIIQYKKKKKNDMKF